MRRAALATLALAAACSSGHATSGGECTTETPRLADGESTSITLTLVSDGRGGPEAHNIELNGLLYRMPYDYAAKRELGPSPGAGSYQGQVHRRGDRLTLSIGRESWDLIQQKCD